MLAALDRQPSLFRTAFTLASGVETFLDPVLVILVLAASVAYWEAPVDGRYVLLSLVAFSLSFPGQLRLADRPRRMVRETVMGWLAIAAILVFFGYASGYIGHFPLVVLATWLIATPLVMVVLHELARRLLPKVITLSAQTTAVVAGVNDVGLRLVAELQRNPFHGQRFLGFFDDRARTRLEGIGHHLLLGRLGELAEYVRCHRVDKIYLALPMATQPRILALLEDLKDTTASIHFVPDIFVTDLIQGRVDRIGGMPVVAVCDTPFSGVNGLVKRLSDVVLSLLILLLISPLLLAIALGVKLSSPGPILFKQRRYGLDGQEIVVYKFRSMTVCEDGAQIRQATRNDRRITPFGGFLRRTSLDELPQFINVLQGRMSIVGPRPHAVAHNEEYRKLIKGYMVRHKVKPGITGWAQVNGYRGETETLDKMEKRIEFDLEYLRNWTLNFDLWIIVKTVLVVVRDRHAY